MKKYFIMTFLLLFLNNISHAQSSKTDTTIVYKEAELAGVEVTSYKRIEESDAKKTIYKLAAKTQKNTKADIALMGLPGLIKDNLGFRIAGNDRRCKILIDGVEATKNEIESLDVSEIVQVEIKHISTEGNQYGGEINIIRKKHHETMLNGSIDLGIGTVRCNQSLHPILSFKSDKLEVSTMANINYYTQESEVSMERIFSDGAVKNYSSKGNISNKQNFAMLKSSYFFSPQFCAHIQYQYFRLDTKEKSNITNLNGKQLLNDAYMTLDNHCVNSVLRYNANKNSRLFFKGQFMLYRNTNKVQQLDKVYYASTMRQYSMEALQEIDSLHFLGEWHEINYGIKTIFRDNISHTASTLHNNVYMIYLNDRFNLGKDLSAYIQMKGELAEYKLPNITIRKWSFLPSASISYKMPKGNISLIGERYVSRPSIDQLNPEVYYTNEVMQSYGNPELKPQYNNLLTLKSSLQLHGALFSLTASYRYATGLIDPVYFNDMNSSIYKNVGYGNVTTFTLNYMQPLLNRRLNFNISTTAKYCDYRVDADMKEFSQSLGNFGWGYNASLFVSYLTTKKWFYTIRMMVDTHLYDINSMTECRPNGWISISKLVLKDKLKISLAYSNIFNIQKTTNYKFKSLSQTYITNNYLSNIIVSATWNFGKKFKARNIGSNINNDDINIKQ